MVCLKVYLFGGVEICWYCVFDVLIEKDEMLVEVVFYFFGGLCDFLEECLIKEWWVVEEIFFGCIDKIGKYGFVEWVVSWFVGDGFVNFYCNIVLILEGGIYEVGFCYVLLCGLKVYGELVNNKKVLIIIGDDIMILVGGMLLVFIWELEFVGQIKDKLVINEVIWIVEIVVCDVFDYWLIVFLNQVNWFLEWVIDCVDEWLC